MMGPSDGDPHVLIAKAHWVSSWTNPSAMRRDCLGQA